MRMKIAAPFSVDFDYWNNSTKEEKENIICELTDMALENIMEKLSTPKGQAQLRKCLKVEGQEQMHFADDGTGFLMYDVVISLNIKGEDK